MIRLFLRLFKIKDFEPCSSCQTLKEQLAYERDEKQRLLDTLLRIVNPKEVEAAPIEIKPIAQSATLFSRKRAALEAQDREEARIKATSNNIGKPDEIKDLEKELGVEEKEA